MKSLFTKFNRLTRKYKINLPITQSKMGVWKYNILRDHVTLDDLWIERFGHKKNKNYSLENWLENVYTADKSRLIDSLKEYINSRNREGFEFEYRLRKSSGDYTWLYLMCQATKFSNNLPSRLEGIIIDITNQKQIEIELNTKNSEIEALYEESEAQNEEMAAIMDELQKNQMELEAANTRLKISEAKFKKVFDNSPIGIVQTTLPGKIIYINNAFRQIYGFDSLEDMLESSDSIERLYFDRDSRLRLVEKLSKTGFVNALNMTGPKKDGSVVYVNIYMMMLTDEFTGENYITTFVEDITKLKASQFERDLLFNNSDDLLSISDYSGDLKQINNAWTTHLGWEIDELKYMSIYSIIHPDDIKKTSDFREILKDSDKTLTLTNRYRTKNNEYRIIRWNSVAFHELGLIFSTGRDETERYEAEHELKQMWDRLDIALKSGVIGLWDYDVVNDIIIINPNMNQLFGVNTNSIENIMRDWDRVIHRDDYQTSMSAMIKILTGETDTYIAEYRSIMPDGKYKWFFSRGKAVEYDKNGRPIRISGSLMDITEQKEAESKRIQLELKMQQAQKLESLGVLAGGIAHDFNNLLTGILGNSDILLYESPLNKDVQHRLLEIKRAAKLASQLTNQMLAYSGKGSFVIEQVDMNDLIIDMNSLLEASISKKVELVYSFATDLPGIKGDATQLRQIVMNLILNASDAIENTGHIYVRTTTVSLSTEDIESLTINSNLKPGEYVTVEVRDTGCGIDSTKLKQIFDPFYTTKFTGRGLGLSAVSGIIRSHNAGLLVKSTVGTGTYFNIYFPVSHETRTAFRQMERKEHSFESKNLTILIADDEKYIRDLTSKMLGISGYKVRLARNGREAIEEFKKYRDEISCILMDLTMPELDGREALTEIRKIEPDIPIILTSGYCENDIISRYGETGHYMFLQKPYNLEDIISMIENSIGRDIWKK